MNTLTGRLLWLIPLAVVCAQADTCSLLRGTVVKIEAQKQGEAEVGSGAIVSVSDEYAVILTAFHVIDGAGKVSVRFLEHLDVLDVPAADRRQQTELDLAALIVRFSSESQRPRQASRLSVRGTDELVEGSKLLTIGHTNNDWKCLAGLPVTDRSHEANPQRFRFERGTIDSGNSGGPVFEDSGRLVGVLTSTERREAIAVKAETAVAFLQAVHLPLDNLRLAERATSTVKQISAADAKTVLCSGKRNEVVLREFTGLLRSGAADFGYSDIRPDVLRCTPGLTPHIVQLLQ